MKIYLFPLTVFSVIALATGSDFLYLVYQWPPTFCSFKNANCPHPSTSYFTLHGMWPATRYSDSLEGCHGSTFDPLMLRQIPSLVTDLERYWPSLNSSQPNEILWKTQWVTYGTCSQLNQLDYFQEAINRAKSYNLSSLLSSSGIQPGHTHSPYAIYDAIVQATNLHPRISCATNQKGVAHLYQIHFCLDQSAKRFENCTAAGVGYNCDENVLFPPS